MGPTPPIQLTIHAAERGGFIVQSQGDYGDGRHLRFAGSLTDVLEFVRREFAPEQSKAKLSDLGAAAMVAQLQRPPIVG